MWFWVVYLVVDLFRSFSPVWAWAPHVLIGVEVFLSFSLRGALWNTILGGFILLPLHLEMSFRPLHSLLFYMRYLISSHLFGLLLFWGNWENRYGGIDRLVGIILRSGAGLKVLFFVHVFVLTVSLVSFISSLSST